MCDYSLAAIKSRDAAIEDQLVTSGFGNTTTHGFCSTGDSETAVCIRPGTELAFEAEVKKRSTGIFGVPSKTFPHKVARFRQVNLDRQHTYHDALEFPDGSQVMLHELEVGQKAKVLQLPATPKTAAEAKEQERAAFI